MKTVILQDGTNSSIITPTIKTSAHFLRPAVYVPRLDDKGETAIITQLRSKKDENSYFTGWDKCYLKQKSDQLENIFSDYKDLVSAIKEKFSPETLVLMEVPPLKKLPKNEDKQQNL